MHTILLVDDDREVLRSIECMLARSGFKVLTAGNGLEAVAVLGECGGLDLVITDYRMPGMDGIQLARRVKEQYPALPVIMMTGQGDLESYLSAAGLGVVRYLTKPVGLRMLQLTVRTAVDAGGSEGMLRPCDTGV